MAGASKTKGNQDNVLCLSLQMLSVFFNSETVANYEIANNSNVSLYQKFFHGMLNNGVYLAPSPYEVAFLSLCHDDEVITATLSAAEDTLKQLKI